MDSDLVSDSLSSDGESGGSATTLPITYKEKFDELFPYYLALGMTEEQYWDRDCTLVISYREADKLKMERMNQELWLQGAYIYEALCRVSPILHAFAKKGTKALPYISEPFAINEKQAELKQEEEAKKSFDKGMSFMDRLLVDTNKKFERK